MVRTSVVVCVPALLLSGSQSAPATLIVSAWDVHVAVYDYEGEPQGSVARFDDVQPSPWSNSHTAAFGASWTAAQYAFQYDLDSAVFHIDTQQHCERAVGERPECIASGFVEIMVAVDTVVTMQGSFAYTMDSDPMSVGLWAQALTLNPPQSYLFDGDGADSGIDPSQGTLEVSGSAVLRGGTGAIYRLTYGFQLLTYAATPPGSVMTGDGGLEFVLTPVPECSSLGLLGAGVLSVCGRRACRVRSRQCVDI